MHPQRLQVSLVATQQGNAHLHVALATVLGVVGHEGWRHRFENRRLLAHWRGVGYHRRLALGAVHEVPGRPHGHTDRQEQTHHDHDDQLEFAFGCRVFYSCCFTLRHANNPSLIGVFTDARQGWSKCYARSVGTQDDEQMRSPIPHKTNVGASKLAPTGENSA
ncbi:hypothetical protein D3C76_1318860 [compost metagenome]